MNALDEVTRELGSCLELSWTVLYSSGCPEMSRVKCNEAGRRVGRKFDHDLSLDISRQVRSDLSIRPVPALSRIEEIAGVDFAETKGDGTDNGKGQGPVSQRQVEGLRTGGRGRGD